MAVLGMLSLRGHLQLLCAPGLDCGDTSAPPQFKERLQGISPGLYDISHQLGVLGPTLAMSLCSVAFSFYSQLNSKALMLCLAAVLVWGVCESSFLSRVLPLKPWAPSEAPGSHLGAKPPKCICWACSSLNPQK